MKNKPLLMIPGPIEFDDDVLAEMGKQTSSHVAPDFIEVFGQALENTRELFECPKGQPFVVAGTGTFSMDMAAANIVEPGDAVLVINSGYFGDRMGTILERYGAKVTHLRAPIGSAPDPEEVKEAINSKNYKVMTITQVDTSTGVLTDVKTYTKIAKQTNTLVIVDGVCSVAAEELKMEEWGVDIAFTASQKAVGVPPGLALLVASPAALEKFSKRKTPVANYYADWSNWLPIMNAYEDRAPAYFGTPAVNLIRALSVSLNQILSEGLEQRQSRHQQISTAFKSAITSLGLKQLPINPDMAANTMTAPYFPETIRSSDLMMHIKSEGIILAGGLHPEIKTKYFRIGHMGAVSISDILATISAIEIGLMKSGYSFEMGSGVKAVMQSYSD